MGDSTSYGYEQDERHLEARRIKKIKELKDYELLSLLVRVSELLKKLSSQPLLKRLHDETTALNNALDQVL
tara:strand:- start:18570 stop:18782 length:213 start_codon:yes stop_codon:yes gene_type:complete